MNALLRRLASTLSLLLVLGAVHAQAQPCGGGYAPQGDPPHPDARCFEEIGRMYGTISEWTYLAKVDSDWLELTSSEESLEH